MNKSAKTSACVFALNTLEHGEGKVQEILGKWGGAGHWDYIWTYSNFGQLYSTKRGGEAVHYNWEQITGSEARETPNGNMELKSFDPEKVSDLLFLLS